MKTTGIMALLIILLFSSFISVNHKSTTHAVIVRWLSGMINQDDFAGTEQDYRQFPVFSPEKIHPAIIHPAYTCFAVPSPTSYAMQDSITALSVIDNPSFPATDQQLASESFAVPVESELNASSIEQLQRNPGFNQVMQLAKESGLSKTSLAALAGTYL